MTKNKRRGSTDRGGGRRGSRSPIPGGAKLTHEEIKAIKSRHRDEEKKKERRVRKKDMAKMEKRIEKRLSKKSTHDSSSSSSSDSESDSDSGTSTDATPTKKKKGKKKQSKQKSKVKKLREKLEAEQKEKELKQSELDTLHSLVGAQFKDSTEPCGEASVTLTMDQYEELKRQAHDVSHHNSPVKVGLFDLSSPGPSLTSTSSQGIVDKLESTIKQCDESCPLEDHGPREISSKNAALVKSFANKCHQKYFSTPDTLKLLTTMVKNTSLNSRATRGPTILTAILKTALSRGINVTADQLGLEESDISG